MIILKFIGKLTIYFILGMLLFFILDIIELYDFMDYRIIWSLDGICLAGLSELIFDWRNLFDREIIYRYKKL